MSATCEPPPEHRGETWHWLRFGDEQPIPWRWMDGNYHDLIGVCPAKVLASDGWRYVGPALPPGEDAADQGRGID